MYCDRQDGWNDTCSIELPNLTTTTTTITITAAGDAGIGMVRK